MDIMKVAMGLIFALVTILIAMALLPSLFASVTPVITNSSYKANFGSTVSLITIVPLLFAVLIIIGIFYFFTKDKA